MCDVLTSVGALETESWEHAKELEHAYAVATASGRGPLDSEVLIHRYLKGAPRVGESSQTNVRTDSYLHPFLCHYLHVFLPAGWWVLIAITGPTADVSCVRHAFRKS